jgi:hypothetical protein
VDDADAVVGVSAAFPRTLRLGARELRAWVLGDFCVSQSLRSLGPAIRLQRAAFDAVERGDVDLVYDFPSRSMMAVHRRMGARQCGELVRRVYLLKADRAVADRIGHSTLAKGLSAAGNTLLASRASLARRTNTVDISVLETDFKNAPDRGLGVDAGVSLERTAEYLNWRYRRDPRGPVTILTSVGAGGDAIVYRRNGDDVEIVDVFGVGNAAILRELILAVVDDARAKDATSVTVSLSSAHPWTAVFGKLGFRERDSAPFVVYAHANVMTDPAPWFLLSGDRDLF